MMEKRQFTQEEANEYLIEFRDIVESGTLHFPDNAHFHDLTARVSKIKWVGTKTNVDMSTVDDLTLVEVRLLVRSLRMIKAHLKETAGN